MVDNGRKVTFRIPDELGEMMDDYAREHEIGASDLLRHAVVFYIKNGGIEQENELIGALRKQVDDLKVQLTIANQQTEIAELKRENDNLKNEKLINDLRSRYGIADDEESQLDKPEGADDLSPDELDKLTTELTYNEESQLDKPEGADDLSPDELANLLDSCQSYR